MDGHRFDAFVRALAARAQTRRSALKLGGAFAALWTGFFGSRPEAALGLDAPPKQIDVIAALIQTTDPSLGPDWRVDHAAWSTHPALLMPVPPAFASALPTGDGVTSGALLTLALPGSNGKPAALIKSILLECRDEATAGAIFSHYTAATAGNVTPLDAADLLGESTGARIAVIAQPDDPDFAANLPGTPAIETSYQEGVFFGRKIFSGNDVALAAGVSKRLIERLKTGSTPGHGLAGQLAFVDAGTPVTAFYSRLDGTEQRSSGADDASFTAQKLAEGQAVDFARASQFIPTTESETFFSVHSWAGRHASTKRAQAWLDGTQARLSAQAPNAQIIAINEADGMGDASQGFLYTISEANGVTVGVDLYVRTGLNVAAVGLSADSTSMTPGMTGFFGNPRPLGAAAQTLIRAQLAAANPPSLVPRAVPLDAVFGGSPLPPAGVQENAGGTTQATTFTACTPPCGKRVVQDQTTPYQVWCQPATKCTDAHCTCNLFRTKKKSTTAEWFGKQNEKKEYDPDNYTYSCSCGTVQQS